VEDNVSRAGDLFYQLRCDKGYKRGRPDFILRHKLTISPEVLRNFERGITPVSTDELEELCNKGLVPKEGPIHQQWLDAIDYDRLHWKEYKQEHNRKDEPEKEPPQEKLEEKTPPEEPIKSPMDQTIEKMEENLKTPPSPNHAPEEEKPRPKTKRKPANSGNKAVETAETQSAFERVKQKSEGAPPQAPPQKQTGNSGCLWLVAILGIGVVIVVYWLSTNSPNYTPSIDTPPTPTVPVWATSAPNLNLSLDKPYYGNGFVVELVDVKMDMWFNMTLRIYNYRPDNLRFSASIYDGTLRDDLGNKYARLENSLASRQPVNTFDIHPNDRVEIFTFTFIPPLDPKAKYLIFEYSELLGLRNLTWRIPVNQ
jgi:hypothetical protein